MASQAHDSGTARPPAGSGGVLIRAQELTKVYQTAEGPLTVLSGLDFEIGAGERVAVVGESGSGKSTLLYLLGALDRPSSGTVFCDHQDIYKLNDDELARFRNSTIAFVWQMNSLLPEFSALENVMMPLLVRGLDRDEAAGVARERLREVGLGGRVTHRTGQLSGGEQQRVALARALAARPKVLLADEPTGNLDFRTAAAIASLLTELHREHGFTSVVVTHNLSFARGSDRILQLEKGGFGPVRPDPHPGFAPG